MRYEQTVLVLGCEPESEQIFRAALNKSGFKAKGALFSDIIQTEQSPACVLIHLKNSDAERALRFMAQPSLLRAHRVIIIDPKDPKARQFCADADIDDMIFKPIHLREMLTRLSYVLDREQAALRREITLANEHDFVRKIQSLSDSAFSGLFILEGRGRDAKIYFEHGTIVGIQFGKKTQKVAASALWRMFPVAYRAIAGINMPPSLALIPFDLTIEQINLQLIKTAAFFRDKFTDICGIASIFRVNGTVYDARYTSLPHQVRRIMQLFDGVRSLESLFDVLELDEILLIQIVRRLIDENLVVECPSQEASGVSLDDWILGTNSSVPKHPSKPNLTPSVNHGISQLRKDLDSVTKYLAELKALEEQLATHPCDKEVTQTAKREITRRQATSEVCVRSRNQCDPTKPKQGFSEAELRDLLHEMPQPSREVTEPLPFEREFVKNHLKKSGNAVITARTSICPNIYYSQAFLNQEAEADEARAAMELEADNALLEISVDTTELEQEEAEAELEVAVQWFNQEIRTRSGSYSAVSKDNSKPEHDIHSVGKDSSSVSQVDIPQKNITCASKSKASAKPHQPWTVEKYQRRHGRELSPEVWKAQIIARLEAEEERRRKLRIIVIAGLIIVILAILAVLLNAYFNNKKISETPNHTSTIEVPKP